MDTYRLVSPVSPRNARCRYRSNDAPPREVHVRWPITATSLPRQRQKPETWYYRDDGARVSLVWNSSSSRPDFIDTIEARSGIPVPPSTSLTRPSCGSSPPFGRGWPNLPHAPSITATARPQTPAPPSAAAPASPASHHTPSRTSSAPVWSWLADVDGAGRPGSEAAGSRSGAAGSGAYGGRSDVAGAGSGLGIRGRCRDGATERQGSRRSGG